MREMKTVAGMLITVCMTVLVIPQIYVHISRADDRTNAADVASVSNSSTYDPAEEGENSDEIITIDVPVIYDSASSPFNFIMDPQGLICRTDAARYGGEDFESDATLYFKNAEGEYDYSHQSDWITVINRSSVPVIVTIEAEVEKFSPIEFTEDSSFDNGTETASVYLALIDDSGNQFPFGKNGSVIIETEIDVSAGEYSFGLTGACKPNGNWEEIAESPKVVISWSITPVLKERHDPGRSGQKLEEDVPEPAETDSNQKGTEPSKEMSNEENQTGSAQQEQEKVTEPETPEISEDSAEPE